MMMIGSVFKIIEIETGKCYVGRSTRMDYYIRKLFKKKFNPKEYRIKVLFTSIGNERQVRDELKVQYQRFLKQCDSSLDDLTKKKPHPKPEKTDKRIGKPSPYAKKVIKVDDKGRPRALFNSVSEASRITGCNKSSIAKVCNNQLEYVKGKDAYGNIELYKFDWL